MVEGKDNPLVRHAMQTIGEGFLYSAVIDGCYSEKDASTIVSALVIIASQHKDKCGPVDQRLLDEIKADREQVVADIRFQLDEFVALLPRR